MINAGDKMRKSTELENVLLKMSLSVLTPESYHYMSAPCLYLIPENLFNRFFCRDYIRLNNYFLIGFQSFVSDKLASQYFTPKDPSLRLVPMQRIQQNKKIHNSVAQLALLDMVGKLNNRQIDYE